MQMVSDVPIGAFLSGGIDSSTVVGFMAAHSDLPIRTYAIGFEGAAADDYYNELPYARRVAQLFSTEHHEIVVRPDVVALLPRLLWHMDEPLSDTAFITTYLVSQFARRDVTVILSGVGGDELFGGYRRYLGNHYHSYFDRLPGWARRAAIHGRACRATAFAAAQLRGWRKGFWRARACPSRSATVRTCRCSRCRKCNICVASMARRGWTGSRMRSVTPAAGMR
jgi:asparagine synthetase B (glutamine-hydrolysing)